MMMFLNFESALCFPTHIFEGSQTSCCGTNHCSQRGVGGVGRETRRSEQQTLRGCNVLCSLPPTLVLLLCRPTRGTRSPAKHWLTPPSPILPPLSLSFAPSLRGCQSRCIVLVPNKQTWLPLQMAHWSYSIFSQRESFFFFTRFFLPHLPPPVCPFHLPSMFVRASILSPEGI